jgi:hypothetical protein
LNGIDVIKKLHLCPFEWHRCNFLIKKITSMPFEENTRRCSSIPQTQNYNKTLYLQHKLGITNVN